MLLYDLEINGRDAAVCEGTQKIIMILEDFFILNAWGRRAVDITDLLPHSSRGSTGIIPPAYTSPMDGMGNGLGVLHLQSSKDHITYSNKDASSTIPGSYSMHTPRSCFLV